MWYRRNSDESLRRLERLAKTSGLSEDIEAYSQALNRKGFILCNCESTECGHSYPCLEKANLDTSTPVGAVCTRCASIIPPEFHNSDCWCRACAVERVGEGIITTPSPSMSDIREWGFIPQFAGLQGPNMHWFGHPHDPSLEHEKWHEWYVVSMHPRAYHTALALGIKILPLNRSGFPIDPKNRNADILMEDYEEWLANRQSEYAPHFIMKSKDVWPLARYFALASRRNYRGNYDYGVLEPGWGWGEYSRSYFGKEQPVWIAQAEYLSDDYLDRIRSGRFKELKAPDTGSLITGDIELDRDLEWI